MNNTGSTTIERPDAVHAGATGKRTLCATRAVKVLKYLYRSAPQAVPRSSLHALEKLPSGALIGLHTDSDWDKVTDDALLKDWLTNNPIPSPKAKVSQPLFHGTLVFVQLIFQQPNQPASSLSMADVQTAANYAALAVLPIQRYASQYGPNSVNAWPNVMPFIATLTGTSFTQAQFEGWVEQCAQIARESNVSNPCIVILHNRDLPNSGTFSGHRDSFHSMTSNGTPYCYALVFGEDLSISDNNHLINGRPNEKVYAHNLSHEIAEMVVDPAANDENPEVCDACAGNCNNSLFDLFDQNGVFIGGTADTASAPGFAFFINSIVSASAALDSNQCIVQSGSRQSACVYPPPFLSGELLSYGDAGTSGNVSAPVVVGLGGWLNFKFLFAGANAIGQNRIYAVDQKKGQLLSYGDAGTPGNVSAPIVVGFGGWQNFKFLFAGSNASGQNRIYAVDHSGQLLTYADAGTPGNVSAPTVVGLGGWLNFKFLFAGKNSSGVNRIYAVDYKGELLAYGDAGTPGNVSAPMVVGFGGWQNFKILFGGANATGQNRLYAVVT